MNSVYRKSFCHMLKISLLIFSAISLMPFVSQANPLRGDVTNDGLLDGRDALLIMRHVAGIELLPDELLSVADVHPKEGPDGNITKDDALRILQVSVGLIAEGDLSGDFTAAEPEIGKFEPQTGSAGNAVVIYGKNFAANNPNENIVLFGDVEAEIVEITGTKITTRVPWAAESNPITVMTPGGLATSRAVFHVTEMRDGRVNITELPSDGMTIVGTYGEVRMNADGSFSIPRAKNEVTFLGAVSSADGNNSYLAVDLPLDDPNGMQEQAPAEISALSTAKALIFLHPFIGTKNKAAAHYVMQLMDSVPEVQQLAQAVEQRYPAGADGLNDAAVKAAWTAAVEAVLTAMPKSLAFNPSQPAAKVQRFQEWYSNTGTGANAVAGLPKAKTATGPDRGSRMLADDDQTVKVLSAGTHFIVASYNKESKLIEVGYPENNDYSPLDWIGTLYRLDPADLPHGVKNQFLISEKEHKLLDYQISTMIEANLWTSKIDILGTAIDAVYGGIMDWISFEEDGLPLQDQKDGVYILRMFSGVLKNNDRFDVDAIASMKDGKKKVAQAAALNMAIALTDFMSLFGGDDDDEKDEESGQIMKIALQSCQSTLTGEMSNNFVYGMQPREVLSMLMEALQEAGRNVVDKLVEDGVTAAQKKLKGAALQALNTSVSILGALEKLSTVGQVGERIAGMMGYLLNVLDWELSMGPTPLETFVIVVGDPFRPEVHDFNPKEGGEGTKVTITGEGFLERQREEDAYNEAEGNIVYFGDKLAKVLEVKSSEEIVVQVPGGLKSFSNVTVQVGTTASTNRDEADAKYFVNPIPIITKITPSVGYAKPTRAQEGFENFAGTQIGIEGFNFNVSDGYEDVKVYFNNTEAPIISNKNNVINVFVPQIEGGVKSVTVRANDRGVRSNSNSFFVYGPPEIDRINPSKVKAGEYIRIEGRNLIDAIVYIEDQRVYPIRGASAFDFVVQVPNLKPDGGELSLKVVTPAGTTSQSFTREPGIQAPELAALPYGLGITVNTDDPGDGPNGKFDLLEAISITSGKLNPFLPPYDDGTTIQDVTFTESIEITIDADGEEHQQIIRKQSGSSSRLVITGSKKDFKYIVHHIILPDKSVNTYTDETIPLDENPEDWEEADRLSHPDTMTEKDFREFDGSKTADRIWMSLYDKKAVNVSGFQLDEHDSLTQEGDGTLNVSGDITLKNGSELLLKEVSVGSIVSKGSKVTINAVTVTAKSDAIILEENYGSRATIHSVSYTGGNAITVNKGGANNIGIGRISNAEKDGVYIYQSDENTISPASVETPIENCKEYAYRIVEGRLNELPRTNVANCGGGIKLVNAKATNLGYQTVISDCEENGLHLEGIVGLSLEYLRCLSNGGHGVYMKDCTNNDLRLCTLEGNGGSGMYMDSGCQQNRLDLSWTLDNNTGLTVSGPNTSGNLFEWLEIGFYEPLNDIEMVLGNETHGIHLTGGASDNTVKETRIYGSGGHGLLVEGAGTDNNHFEKIYSGSTFHLFDLDNLGEGNDGDGIHVSDGASDNYFFWSWTGNNGQHGIAVVGDHTDRNHFNKIDIGSAEEVIEDATYIFPNQGAGIYVSGAIKDVTFEECAVGVNEGGGIIARNVTSASGQTSVTINDCAIGYSSYYKPISSQLHTTKGTAVEFHNTQNMVLKDSYIFGFDRGFLLHGEQSKNNRIDDLSVRQSHEYGIRIEGTENTTVLESGAGQCGGDAVQLVDIKSGYFDLGGGTSAMNGMTMTNCENIELLPGSSSNILNGMVFDRCKSLVIDEMSAYREGGNGIVFTNQCENIRINQFSSIANMGAGLVIEDSKDITLHDHERTEGESLVTIFNNESGGIVLDNVQNITIGKDGKGIEVRSDDLPALHIKGDETSGVTVESSQFGGSLESACVLIESGKDILFGSKNGNLGNYVGGYQAAGLYISGEDTKVTVINNDIGRYEVAGLSHSGNKYGIVLDEGIHGVLISGNRINQNNSYGIWIKGGAHENVISRNEISYNRGEGVYIEGGTCIHNIISQNAIYQNSGEGIELVSGGNGEIEAPVITDVNQDTKVISGETEDAPDGSIVEVYFDRYDEGEFFTGASTLYGNKFVVHTNHMQPNRPVHAIIIHPDGNTSQFGERTYTSDPRYDPFIYVMETAPGNLDVYARSNSSRTPVAITSSSANDFDPQVVDYSRRILFVSGRNGNQDLWVKSTNADDAYAVTFDESNDYDPDFFQDKKGVVFTSERDGNPEIYLTYVDFQKPYGELAMFGGDIESSITGLAGDEFGSVIQTTGGYIDSFDFYIAEDPAEFDYKIYTVTDYTPTELLTEGTVTPSGTGWNHVEIEPFMVSTDFMIALSIKQNNQPKLGTSYDGEYGHSRKYILASDEWRNDSSNNYMIKVFLRPLDPIRLTNDPSADREPVFSPDGNQVAFTSDRDGQNDIWIMNIDGTGLENLTNGQGNNSQPDWNAFNGSTICFVSDRDGNPEIYTVNVQSRELERITENEAVDRDPAWHSNSNTIYYSSNLDAGFEVYKIWTGSDLPNRLTLSANDAIQPQGGSVTMPNTSSGKVQIRQAGELVVSAIPVSGEPGDTVEMQVLLAGARALGNLYLDLQYDHYLVELIQEPDYQILDNAIYEQNPFEYPSGSGRLRFDWVNPAGIDGESVVANLSFKIKEEAQKPKAYVRFNRTAGYDVQLAPFTALLQDTYIGIEGIEVSVFDWQLF